MAKIFYFIAIIILSLWIECSFAAKLKPIPSKRLLHLSNGKSPFNANLILSESAINTNIEQVVKDVAIVGENDSMMKVTPSLSNAIKLIVGVGGIYASFLYYGALQEDVFKSGGKDGAAIEVWFVQALEALANVIVGGIGLLIVGPTKSLPQDLFMISGATQILSKVFTSLSLVKGVSFPVVTLAKSGKMMPVMLGSLLLGGASYTLQQCLSVAAIILGTALVSMSMDKPKSMVSSTTQGLLFVVASLVADGITGGTQKRLKAKSKALGNEPNAYDFMFWTNLYMATLSSLVALVKGEFGSGIKNLSADRDLLMKVVKFALCSAAGQSFIFYTIANFDPLVLSTVTTTRKIFSVLLSIFLKGHHVKAEGWGGILLASSGIIMELFEKTRHVPKKLN